MHGSLCRLVCSWSWLCPAQLLQTFLGVKIVQLLLHNAAALGPPRVFPGTRTGGGDGNGSRNEPTLGPILCVCYTNHALDQFLEGLLDAGITKVSYAFLFSPSLYSTPVVPCPAPTVPVIATHSPLLRFIFHLPPPTATSVIVSVFLLVAVSVTKPPSADCAGRRAVQVREASAIPPQRNLQSKGEHRPIPQ